MSRSSDASQAASVDDAIEAFRRGRPVMIHDAADREGETDLVYPASAVTPEAVARLRNEAGGLVCVALSDAVARAFDLPFRGDVLEHPATEDHDLSYDDRSSFSLTVNHRETHTGITDADRARTITALADVSENALEGGVGAAEFARTFRVPGHVHLLRAAPSLADRQGHTELGVALAEAAGRAPAVVVCEMLDDETGDALSPAVARSRAERNGLVYVEGAAILDRLA